MRVLVVVVTLAMAAVARQVMACMQAMVRAVQIMAVARAHPTRVSLDKTLVMVAQMVPGMVLETAPRRAASVAHRHRALRVTILTNASHAPRVTKCSARTHAALGWTWANNEMTLTNANPAAMSLQAFHRLACLHVAAVVVAVGATVAVVVAIAAAAAVETGAVVARALVAVAVAGATLAADFNANRTFSQE